MPSSAQTTAGSLGCCWGDMVILSSMGSTSTSSAARRAATPSSGAFVDGPALFYQQAGKCGVVLSGTPCAAAGGMEVVAIESSLTLTGQCSHFMHHIHRHAPCTTFTITHRVPHSQCCESRLFLPRALPPTYHPLYHPCMAGWEVGQSLSHALSAKQDQPRCEAQLS